VETHCASSGAFAGRRANLAARAARAWRWPRSESLGDAAAAAAAIAAAAMIDRRDQQPPLL